MVKTIKVKALGFILPAFAAAAIAASTIPTTTVAAEGSDTEAPVFEVSTADGNVNETIKEDAIKQRASVDSNINLDTIDMEKSTIDINGLDYNKRGLQSVTLKISLANKNDASSSQGVGYSFVVNKATVKLDLDSSPKLSLVSDAVTVNNGDTFNAENYISYISDDSKLLPALKVNSNVDTATDGTYSVTYDAVDLEGNTTEKTLTVTVATPQEVIDQQAADAAAAAAAQAQADADAKAKEEADAKAKKEAEDAAALAASGDTTATVGQQTNGENPYSGGWSNCTWGAWQLAYQYTGISLPNFGNAWNWLSSAQSCGYSTGTTPSGRAIAVYSHHVAYVDCVKPDGTVTIEEGGYCGGYNKRTVSASGTGTQSLIGYIYLP